MTDRSGADTPAQPAASGEVIYAKLRMPRLAQGVARPRLFELLDRARQKAAVWLAAPGGAGKTTAVATYITERQLPYIWLQLDKDDADPATFFYYLGLAAKSAVTDRDIHLPLLTPEYLSDIPGFARRFFRDLFTLIPRGTVLVLDNHQDVGNTPVFDLILRNAIEEVPAENNLIIISRSNPSQEFARHKAYGTLDIITWDAIRLTLDETALVASGVGDLDPSLIQSLHQRCEGWAAALTLLLEHIKVTGPQAQGQSVKTVEAIFDYFASELFDSLPDATRDFLLKTSLFPYMTPALAEGVSGNAESAKILADFHRRHFFTDRMDAPEYIYQYHALFREFLLARLEQAYTPSEHMDLADHAGQLLVSQAWHAEAINLYLQVRRWETAAALIQMQAPALLAQGRAQSVATWIQQLPEEHIESDSWLLFWLGVSQQFTDPRKAQARLEHAYESFTADEDIAGQILAASAIIDITYFLRWNLTSVTPWVKVLQNHLDTMPVSLSTVMEARVLSSLVGMLEYMNPTEARLPKYVERLDSLLRVDMDVNQKMLIALRLISYYAEIYGDADACDRVLHYIKALQESPDITAPNRFAWMIMSILPHVFADSESEIARGQVDALLAAANDGNLARLLEANNLAFLEPIANCNIVLLHLRFGDIAAARSLLNRVETLLTSSQSIDMAVFTMEKSMCALAEGDFVSARKYGLTSLQVHAEIGAMLTLPEVCCTLAIERCESGEPGQAFDYLASLKHQESHCSPRMLYQVSLIEAYAYFLQGDTERCHASLREAFGIGRAHYYWGSVSWLWRILPRLCAEALRADIEPDYVRQLVKRRGLLPPEPTVENWPWQVRIHTLGHFKLIIDDKPFDAHSKGQTKPLELLSVLIAGGGKGVKRDRLCDILWPDSEADAALFTVSTTLARLRKIIGDDAAYVKNGRVYLNEDVCWVDVYAIERLFDEADQLGADAVDWPEVCDSIMALYQGPFLHDEHDMWSEQLRNRLRSKLSRFVVQYCRILKDNGQPGQSANLKRRALEADPGCEKFIKELTSGRVASK